MTAPRKIASNAELQDIAEAGTGFVIDPFNRWWHVATCPRIATMTVGEAKWFAPTRAALDTYLEDRLARHHTAKPILACATCTGIGRIAARGRSVATSPNHEVFDALARPPHVERSNACFEVWADECVRNESKAASSAGRLRGRIKAELAALPDPDGHVLHAAYAGIRSEFTDVENLLFNNIDQELSAFRSTGRFGVRFEDLGKSAPVAPDGSSRPSFYRYRLAEPCARTGPGTNATSTSSIVVVSGRPGTAIAFSQGGRRSRQLPQRSRQARDRERRGDPRQEVGGGCRRALRAASQLNRPPTRRSDGPADSTGMNTATPRDTCLWSPRRRANAGQSLGSHRPAKYASAHQHRSKHRFEQGIPNRAVLGIPACTA